VSGGLALLLERGGGGDAWVSLEAEVVTAVVAGLRARQWTHILTSYDVITLPAAASMLHLSAAVCKEGKYRERDNIQI
jgi:hypothetical protein